jgi:hypothetical protein
MRSWELRIELHELKKRAYCPRQWVWGGLGVGGVGCAFGVVCLQESWGVEVRQTGRGVEGSWGGIMLQGYVGR